jgi:hypothetical protein
LTPPAFPEHKKEAKKSGFYIPAAMFLPFPFRLASRSRGFFIIVESAPSVLQLLWLRLAALQCNSSKSFIFEKICQRNNCQGNRKKSSKYYPADISPS